MEPNRPRPNLFLVGAMKAGTTSLHNYLDAHPEVFMTQEPWKETQYFVAERNWSKGETWYLDLFQSAGPARYLGESSTDYTKLPHYSGVAERIAKFSPSARILYLMRDPVERSISHYWWEVQWSGEGRDMLSAMKKVCWITDVSHYALQLRPYLELFGRENVLALTTEQLSQAPEETLARIFHWLGVDSTFVPGGLHKRHNVSQDRVPQFIGAKLLSPLRGGRIWNTVKQVVPAGIRQKTLRTFSRPVERDMSQAKAAAEYLRPIQRAQTAELSELLGRDFAEWTTLYSDDTPGGAP